MRLSDFDYALPEGRVALHPASPRESARLLVVRPCLPDARGGDAPAHAAQDGLAQGRAVEDRSSPQDSPQDSLQDSSVENSFAEGNAILADHHIRDLPGLLQPGDVLVFNDTKVIPARLQGLRIRGAHSLAFEANLVQASGEGGDTWQAFARPGKRLKLGDRVVFGAQSSAAQDASSQINPENNRVLAAQIIDKTEEGLVTFRFEQAGAELFAALEQVGGMPLPPYILEARKREAQGAAAGAGPAMPEGMQADIAAQDARDYQTIFARKAGAVAAPTASLHVTPELLEQLAARGIAWVFVTLHVGAGTFLPVKTDDITAHKMHAEWGEIGAQAADTLNAARTAGQRVIAVGTTACRLLESATDAQGIVQPFCGQTDIFIRPGYRFRVTDALITNFHLPKSTLLMLVSAFSGVETMRAAYAHALAGEYRFYSYGDACLLFPQAMALPSPRSRAL